MNNLPNAIQNNLVGMLSQFKQNPMQFLLQRRMNLPQNINFNDPQAILNHLVQSGQVSQQQINNAYQMMGQFRK